MEETEVVAYGTRVIKPVNPPAGSGSPFAEVKKAGLDDGDIIACVVEREDGSYSPYEVVEVDSEDHPGEVAYSFRLRETSSRAIIDLTNDTKTHLEVVRVQNAPKWIGFRASAAGNRFLQARRRGLDRMRFYSTQFGTFEQWEFSNGEPSTKVSFSRLKLFFKNRRLPMFELRVEVVRIGHAERSEYASAGLQLGSDGSSEQQNVMRAMSGLLTKEWYSFVEKEVKTRK
eukprot:gene23028-27863_t